MAKAETLNPCGRLLAGPERSDQPARSTAPEHGAGRGLGVRDPPDSPRPFRIPGARLRASSRRHKLTLAIPACQSSADGLTRNPTAVRPTARSTGEGPMSSVRSIIGVTTTRPSRALPVGLPALLLMSP